MKSLSSLQGVARVSLLFGAMAGLSGCGTVSYLFQATRGQMALFNHAKPVSEVIQDEKTPPRIRRLLAEIDLIKKFGEENGVRPTPNYRDYVDLKRPAAVWVVSASEPLRFVAKEWSFPIVGSFPYLGWFDLGNAKAYRDELTSQGWDADVRGAAAYSTLGWFRDSILSSMISDDEDALGDLVNTILHESVHATLYVSGQSYFDESVASYVADALTPQYMEKTRGKDSPELKAYLDSLQKGESRRKRLHEVYQELEKLYASSIPDAEKLLRKADLLARVRTELGYKRDINNATLIQYKTYNTGTPDFERVFRACDSNWSRFLQALGTLTPESFGKPQQDQLGPVLEKVAREACVGAPKKI